MDELRDALRAFARERDWLKFHTPKNLSMALSVEVAELLEHFQWLENSESFGVGTEKHFKIQEEIGDVLIYLVRLSDVLDIDPLLAAKKKFERNSEKYPADAVRGSSKKYDEYEA